MIIPHAKNFPKLALVAHPAVPIVPGQNVVWCDTVQLAWNQSIDWLGDKPHFVKEPPPVVSQLNAQQYTKADCLLGDFPTWRGSA